MRAYLFILALLLALPAFAGWQAVVSPTGAVQLMSGETALGTLSPGLFEAGWRYASLSPAGGQAAEGLVRGVIHAPGGGVVDTEVRYSAAAGGVHLVYRLTPRGELHLNSLHVDLPIPLARVLGGTFALDGVAKPFPATLDKVGLAAGLTSDVALVCADGSKLNLHLAAPTPVLMQDDRQWGGGFSLRIGPQSVDAPAFPAGTPLVIDLTLTAPGGVALVVDGPVTLAAGPEWIPLDAEQEIVAGSALDFSHLVPWEAPAGKLGRVVANADGHFVFTDAPGKPVRFYGVNLCFTGQYLPHEQADLLATRLQRLGYNAVRVHHYESELVDRAAPGVALRADQLDKLDYLFAALKARGIYVTTDLYVSRPVPAAAVYDGATGQLGMDEFKYLVPVNARAYENYLTFARQLLGHVNPYTKLTWAEDPTLAWISLINENNTGNFLGGMTARGKADWAAAWTKWRTAQGLPDAPWTGNLDTDTSRFLAETEAVFMVRTRKVLREELHCNALLTDCNSWSNPLQLEGARTTYDYVDDHFYVSHPQFLENPWRIPSKSDPENPAAASVPGGRHNAFTRLVGKPFTITEFNYAAPYAYRGASGLLTGTLAALQDWDGLWRFAYSHWSGNLFQPQPLSYFDLACDPLNQAAERATLCLFRRGDLTPAPHLTAITFTPESLRTAPARNLDPAWDSLAWLTRVGTEVLSAGQVSKADLSLPYSTDADPYARKMGTDAAVVYVNLGWTKGAIDLQKGKIIDETGALHLDAAANTFTVDTPGTQGGFVSAGSTVHTSLLNITVKGTTATVWVSSLDGKPIKESTHLLITHLTDLQDTGATFNDRARTVLLNWGTLPYLVHAGMAEVTLLSTTFGAVHVWGLSPGGKRLGEITCWKSKDARGVEHPLIPLDVDDHGHARMLYEVEITR